MGLLFFLRKKEEFVYFGIVIVVKTKLCFVSGFCSFEDMFLVSELGKRVLRERKTLVLERSGESGYK